MMKNMSHKPAGHQARTTHKERMHEETQTQQQPSWYIERCCRW